METVRFYQKCLREDLAKRIAKNPRYSLRSYARAMKIHVSLLSRLLSGKKIPTPELSRRLLSQLSLAPKEEKLFLQSMAAAYESEGVKRKSSEIKKLLSNTAPANPELDLTPEVFRIISDWYHYSILQLSETEGFRSETRWIAKQLGIQEVEAKLAISRLLELGFLEEKDGHWVRATEKLTSGDLKVTTAAHRRRIRQVHELSLNALEEVPIEQRNHTTMTLAIDPDQIPRAKEMIQTFMDQLALALGPKKKQVYELQINLFPTQKGDLK